MHGMLPLLILLGIGVFLVKFVLPGLSRGQVALPYQKEPALFTPAERAFLAVLEQALGGRFRVWGKVRLADVIRVKQGLGGSVRQQAFNRIRSKHLDFVICNPDDLSVEFAVELDDSSHQKARRKARDEFIDKALAAAGVPIFHFPVKRSYAVAEIQATIFEQTSEPTP